MEYSGQADVVLSGWNELRKGGSRSVGRCFVIQPFDKGAYDKLYEDVIVPAITNAGLDHYRVDRDPSTRLLIESIENGIRSSEACVAEITTDNPNVWYELGFAMANDKPLVMISNSKERTAAYPFDVSHRPIITYTPESPRDFQTLQFEITKRLKSLLQVNERAQKMASIQSSETISGLSPHEIAALQIVMENQLSAQDTMPASEVQQQMVTAGFSRLAGTVSLRLLEKRGFMEAVYESTLNGNPWWCCRVSSQGIDWLLSHQSLFQLRHNSSDRPKASPESVDESPGTFTDDDVPF